MSDARLIAGRYRLVRPLGRGGNAQVYEVVDEAQDTRVALKCLSTADAARERSRALFQREFNTLSQIAHPLIVRAYDYGVDETPYYTMELIAGQPLRGQFPWPEVCSLLRDVASALSFVHSRRLVHRDVSHRNVYRTNDGHAKLFDFGALVPMGPTSDVVGTPPFMPPEAVAELRLDARSDSFSLGALGYLLLTERHAFPARHVRDLGEAWRRPVEAPSHFTPDVPAALDDLIVSLLSLNPVARPSSAAEVFNRLTAIAALPQVEAPEVARAYLDTPALVGREDATHRFKKSLTRASERRATPLTIEGGDGFGRSRLLASFLLEAKLDGCLAFHADARSADEGPFGVCRALARRLFAADPFVARDAAGEHAALLSPLLFDASAETPAASDGEGGTPALVEALCAMFVAAAEVKPIVVGVDDFERMDAYSKQFFVRLAAVSTKSRLVLVVALRQDATTDAHTLLRDLSGSVALAPLSPSETRQLVCSLFGDVDNVDAVSRWIHELSGGRPRAALEAATHLVDSAVARLEEGLWVLPRHLDPLELPVSVDQALDAKIALLDADAATLCRALALSSEQDPLFPREYADLAPGISDVRLDAATNELVARSIVVPTTAAFAFVHAGVREAARRSIPARELASVHRSVAGAYASGATPSLALSAHHALQAGDVELAFTRAVESVQRRTAISVRSSAFLRTPEGTRSFETLFEWGLAHRKPWAEVLALGQMLLQHATVADIGLVRHKDKVVERLCTDSGLLDFEAMADIVDPVERMKAAIRRAERRHEAERESERGVPPRDAIEGLCGAVAGLAGVFSRRSEPLEVAKLLPLVEPFSPLVEAAAVVRELVAMSADALFGRDVRNRRLALLETVSSPVPGLDEVSRTGIWWLCLYYEALDEASRGEPGSVKRVEPLLQNAIYAPLAWEVAMVAALFQGDLEGADAAKRKRDLSNLAHSADVGAQLDGGLVYEVAAVDHLGEVLRLKPLVAWLEQRARTCPAATARYELQLGNYHRLRGELPKALAAYERALEAAPRAGCRGEWSYVVFRLGYALIDAGRLEQARTLMANALGDAVAQGPLHPFAYLQIEMVLAVAEAALGMAESGIARSEKVIAAAVEQRLGGVIFVNLCKDQGRVATFARDDRLMERVIARLEDIAAHAKHPAFATKQAHLLRNAQGKGQFQVAPNPQKILGAGAPAHPTPVISVRTQIELCRGSVERAKRALRILLEAAASDEGFLYLCENDTLKLAASTAGAMPPSSLEAALFERVRSGTAEGDTTGETEATRLRSLRPPADEQQYDVIEVIARVEGGCVLAALAAMKPRGGFLAPVPLLVREGVSGALIAAGDTQGIPWI